MDENRPAIRVMALHALAYCERLFYLEEVEQIRVADDRVYDGRTLHQALDDDGELVRLQLESEGLGIRGKVDAIRRRDGRLIPHEHKKGRAREGDDGPEAWVSDRLQVGAYAMLIEEATGELVSEGRIRYHGSNATVRIQEGAAKALVADARRRVYLDKASLVGVSFEPAFRDDRTRLRFANWVAGRYNRPAIANELVEAIQKPVVVAVEELAKKKDSLLGILDRVTELRFAVPDPRSPWTVHFIVMIDEEEGLIVEEEAELAGWLEQLLVTAGSSVGAIVPRFRTEKTISLHDYQNTTRLQLDHFSPEEDA